MKQILLITLLVFALPSSAQRRIAKNISQLQQTNIAFTPISVFSLSPNQDLKTANKAVTQATLVDLDIQSLSTINNNRPDFIRLQIPYQQEVLALLLYKVDPFADGFHLDTDKQKNYAFEKGVFYRGIIENSTTSVASFNFFSDECNGMFSDINLGNVIVGKLDEIGNQNSYIIYNDKNLKVQNEFDCHFKDDKYKDLFEKARLAREVNTVKCVTMYFEVDFNLYQSNGSSVTTTSNWMTSLFNNVQTLFDNDGITTALKSIFVWTTPDIYNGIGDSSADYLTAFAENRPTFDGDVGHLVGVDPGGLGGVAFLDSVCEQINYAYSDLNGISFSTVPTYSWAVQVITHEFGHSLGSPHTHGCYWNGNGTAIDGCGQQAGYEEGNCPEGPIPTNTQGSIMSYCHLVSGVGINFANGFLEQPATLIQNTVNSKDCLSSDCINTCINTITQITTTQVSTTSVTLTWTDVSQSATSWQIQVTPFGGNGSWITVTTNSYTATNLNPNSYYLFRIRPICQGLTPTVESMVFATSGNYCAGMTFTDTGGLNGNYSNNESFIRVMTPNQPNQKLKVVFNSFDLEFEWDYLYIYDGSDTNAPSINPLGYTGSDSPGTIVSTAPDGSLTFRFFSDEVETTSGWNATISCVQSLGTVENSFTDFSYYPNPTKNTVTLKANVPITQIVVFNVEGRKLMEISGSELEQQVNLTAFASGTYFFKATTGDIEQHFKILKY